MTIDYDYIKQKVDVIKEKHGDIKPRPPGFVSESMAVKLTNRCRPLVAFITEYARLCDEANEVLDISDNQMKWLDSFMTDITLLDYVEDVHAHKYRGNSFRLKWLIQTIKSRKNHVNISDYLIKLFILIKGVKMFNVDKYDTHINEYEYQVLYGKLQEVKAVEQQQQSNTKTFVTQ